MENNRLVIWAKKYSPEILMSMGLAGMTFATVWCVNATIKATRKIDAKKAAEKKEKLTFKDIFKETWKLYLPVVLGTAVSVPCIIAGNRQSNKRNAALATAYTLSEAALHEYQTQTRKLIGEKKAKEIDEAVATEKVNNSKASNKEIILSDGKQLFFEPMTGRYFESNWNEILSIANSLNEEALANTTGIIYLNDFLERLGLDSVQVGDVLGWCTPSFGSGKGLIKIEMDTALTKDNKACGCINYVTRPYPIN